jgi:hypothetical protein
LSIAKTAYPTHLSQLSISFKPQTVKTTHREAQAENDFAIHANRFERIDSTKNPLEKTARMGGN